MSKFKDFWKSRADKAVGRDAAMKEVRLMMQQGASGNTIRREIGNKYGLEDWEIDDMMGNYREKSVSKAEMSDSQAESSATSYIRVDNEIWNRFGFRGGSDVDKNWEKYLSAVRSKVSSTVPRKVWELIEDENHHSFIQALQELGKLGR